MTVVAPSKTINSLNSYDKNLGDSCNDNNDNNNHNNVGNSYNDNSGNNGNNNSPRQKAPARLFL